MSLMWRVACALALAFPFISMSMFRLAGLVGVTVGTSSGFTDVVIWGLISLVLALMSFFGWRRKSLHSNTAHQESRSIWSRTRDGE
jgi:uncharacterized membrane protein YjfL (UPF0719 family)